MGIMEVVPEINTCGRYQRGLVAPEDMKIEAQGE